MSKDKDIREYEEVLFAEYRILDEMFQSIYRLAMQNQDMEKVRYLVEKRKELTHIFELGEYHEVSCQLELATIEKDADRVLDVMEKMLNSIESICGFCESDLYEHMEFNEMGEDSFTALKTSLLKSFQDEEAYGFLKEDKRWQELVKE